MKRLLFAVLFATSVRGQIVSLSSRLFEGTGTQQVTVGFTIPAGSSQSILIRDAGPALTAFGISGAISDPAIALYQGNTLIDSNNDWQDTNGTAIAAAAAARGAFAFTNGSTDSALLDTLSRNDAVETGF
jgi:hypothetical protein